jgi:hypothetical protein
MKTILIRLNTSKKVLEIGLTNTQGQGLLQSIALQKDETYSGSFA